MKKSEVIDNNDFIKLLKDKGLDVCEFSSRDEDEFYNFLRNSNKIDKNAFENNWPYILQSTRNGHYKFYFKNSIVYFTLRFRRSKSNFIAIVNFLGKEKEEAILRFCNVLKINNFKFLIKNIDKNSLAFWKENGFVESVTPWSKYSFRDDNTLPQNILSSEIIKATNFDKNYKRLFKKFQKTEVITEIYQSSRDKSTRKLLSENAKFLYKKGVDEKEEIVRAHLFFFDDDIKRKVKLQHLRNGKLIGFSYWTLIENVAFGNILICKNEKDLMKYLAYVSMKYIVDNFPQIKFFSVQGSENKGQNFFKERFKPVFSIEKTHINF